MRALSILSIALSGFFVWACSSTSEQTPTKARAFEEHEAIGEPTARASEPPTQGVYVAHAMAPLPVFDDERSAWAGEWATTSRVTHSTCASWPIATHAGTTRVIRHNEGVFQVRRINGWSAYGVASDGPELTLQQSWKEPDGSPVALTLKLRFESANKFVMTTEIVVAPWSEQPDGCEAYLEEIGVRG